jgi:hypothetical protein
VVSQRCVSRSPAPMRLKPSVAACSVDAGQESRARLGHVTLPRTPPPPSPPPSPAPATTFDLGTGFYLTPEHVAAGVARADACRPSLAELNPYCAVDVLAKSAADIGGADIVGSYDVVVLTDAPREHQLRINAICRAATPAVGFIASGASFVPCCTRGRCNTDAVVARLC